MMNTLLCCDWGTSSFRLRWVDAQTGRVYSDVRSHEGIATTHTAWQASGADRSVTGRLTFYQQVLTRHIAQLEAQIGGRYAASPTGGQSLAGVPIVLSGMASASIGLLEVPYASLPFPTDGRFAGVRYLNPTANFPHPMLLISGVRSETDVMRGEETQLVGLYQIWREELAGSDETILILPGTHSKHIVVRDGIMVDFRTYLTGELFALLTTHSILKDSVQPAKSGQSSDWPAFREGVQAGAERPLLHTLFSVRTNQLFGRLSRAQNHEYMSGLLIGSEVALLTGATRRVVLGSGGNLFPYYEQAMQELNLSFISVPADVMENSAVAGQLAIYNHQTAHSGKHIADLPALSV